MSGVAITIALVAIAVLSFAVYLAQYVTHCNHDWKILSSKETESQAERFGRLTGQVPNPRTSDQVRMLVEKKIIQVIVCEKCGKMKKLETVY